MSAEALYEDAFAISGILFDELDYEGRYPQMRRVLIDAGIDVVDRVESALEDRDDIEAVLDADAALTRIRTRMRIALEFNLLEEDVYLDLFERADAVSRQLGGLLKHRRRGLENRS